MAADVVYLKGWWEDFSSVPRLEGYSAQPARQSFDKEGHMSEDESRRTADHEEEADEVEAHKRVVAANDEAGDETAGDDVEGHMRKSAPGEEGARTS
jgi:hypothetical protein